MGKDVIDTIIETLYAQDLNNYQILDAQVAKNAALRRIKQTIDKLSKEKQKSVKDEAAYRLDQFEKFHNLSRKEREKVIELAKTGHVSLEEAYRRAREEA